MDAWPPALGGSSPRNPAPELTAWAASCTLRQLTILRSKQLVWMRQSPSCSSHLRPCALLCLHSDIFRTTIGWSLTEPMRLRYQPLHHRKLGSPADTVATACRSFGQAADPHRPSSDPADRATAPLSQKASSGGAKRERGEGAEIMQDNVGCQKSAAEPGSILEAQRAHLRATRLTHFLKAEAQRLVCIRNWTPVNATAAPRRCSAQSRLGRVPPPPFGVQLKTMLRDSAAAAGVEPEWSASGAPKAGTGANDIAAA